MVIFQFLLFGAWKNRPRLYQALDANILTVAEKWSELRCLGRNFKIIWVSVRKVLISLGEKHVHVDLYTLSGFDMWLTWYLNAWLHMMRHIHWIPEFPTYGSPNFIDLDFQTWRHCNSFVFYSLDLPSPIHIVISFKQTPQNRVKKCQQQGMKQGLNGFFFGSRATGVDHRLIDDNAQVPWIGLLDMMDVDWNARIPPWKIGRFTKIH